MGGLRKVLVAEGQCKTMEEVSPEIVRLAEQLGYYFGMMNVITKYKPAAKKRNEQGCDYVDDFRRVANDLAYLATKTAEDQIVVQALLFHDAASSLSVINGNLPDQQVVLNNNALKLLNSVPEEKRDDDWWCVFEKVYSGLVEGGHIEFDEAQYLQTFESMVNNNSKDAAGRANFLANKLEEQGRLAEAIVVLERVENYVHSPANQRDQALATLRTFRERHQAEIVIRAPGTTREHRAEAAAGTKKEASGEDSESHHLIRRRERYYTASGMFFSTRRETSCAAAPTGSAYLKNTSVIWCFFVCLFY